jgi:hypothetical protein
MDSPTVAAPLYTGSTTDTCGHAPDMLAIVGRSPFASGGWPPWPSGMMSVVSQSEPTGLHERQARRIWSGPARLALALVASLAVSWWALGSVLASDRGLDLSDEGLYLLAADPPSATAAWGFPFGWHVRPLFALVGYDIASFRTLGAVGLVACSAWLGLSAGRITMQVVTSGRSTRVLVGLTTIAGALGSLLFYAPMLRTPSYNWSNMVGITIAIAAALTLIALRSTEDVGRRPWLLTIALAGIASLALFSTIPAKPTTLPILLILTTALMLISRGRRPALVWGASLLAFLPVWLLLAYALRLWPIQALDVFRLALAMPAPDPLQTTGAAIRAALLVPRDAIASLLATPTPILCVLVVGLLVASAPAMLRRSWLPVRIAGFLIAGATALAVAGAPVPGLRSSLAAFQIANANVTTGCLIVLFASLVAALPRGLPGRAIGDAQARTRWGMVAVLTMLPFVFSFGSGNGIYAQASLAGGFMLLAAVVSVPRPASWPAGLGIAVGALLAVIAFAATSIVSGWQSPFRAAPLADQTSPTTIGAHGAELLLHPDLSRTITELRSKAMAAGWTDGTPVVDVSFMWNPGIAYALGGRVPDFLALTIFGYPTAHDITDFHLSQPYLDFPFDRMWIITSRPASIADPTGQAGVNFTTDKLAVVTGLPFPASYACVAAGDFILWRPATTPQGTDINCAG